MKTKGLHAKIMLTIPRIFYLDFLKMARTFILTKIIFLFKVSGKKLLMGTALATIVLYKNANLEYYPKKEFQKYFA